MAGTRAKAGPISLSGARTPLSCSGDRTALGRALAAEIGAGFVDGDELGDPSKGWLQQVLTASEKLVDIGLLKLKVQPVLIVARPLRARDWIFFQARFGVQKVARGKRPGRTAGGRADEGHDLLSSTFAADGQGDSIDDAA